MASVTLLDDEGTHVEVSAPWHFVALVYGRGYRPLTGTIAENLDILAADLPPSDDSDRLAILLGDLRNPSSLAVEALSELFLPVGGSTAHTHDDRYFTEAEVTSAIDASAATKADLVHTHDDRYYTDAEVDTLLAAKAASVHTHTSSQISDAVSAPTASRVVIRDSAGRAQVVDGSVAADIATKGQVDTASTADRARANHSGTQTSATLSDLTETVQDIVAALLVAGTNVTTTYDDTANTYTINASGGGTTDPEVVRDTIGGALVAGSGVTITVNDAGDTITIASTAVLPTRQVISGTGLAGGGDLSADRTLSVVYGSAVSTAVQGNDARVVADQVAGTASIRTLGTGAQQAAPGNDTRFSTAASTTVVGHVELADNTETQTGSDTVRAVTPAGLASVTATETRAGLAEVATAGEVSTGTDDARMVTPLKLKTVADLKADKLVTTTTQSGASYTVALADGGTDIEFTNAGATAVNIPTNATAAFPIGTIITFWPRSGQLTVAAVTPGTTTVESRGSAFKSAGTNGPIQAKKRATDGWVLTGDLSVT